MKSLSSAEATLFRAAGTLTSTVGRGGRGLLVLIYHRVLDDPDVMWPDTIRAPQFAAQMDLLAECFNVLPLSEALTRLQSRSLPPRAVSVTFDDGYADNLTVAAPIMRERGVRATVFIATDYLDGGIMFNDAIAEAMRRAPAATRSLGSRSRPAAVARRPRAPRRHPRGWSPNSSTGRRGARDRWQPRSFVARATPPRDLMLTTRAGEVAARRRSRDWRAHGDPPDPDSSVGRGRARGHRSQPTVLEGILGDPVRLFAYPNGRPGEDYDSRHVAIVRELGFRPRCPPPGARSTPGCDRFQVPRVAPWDDSPRRYAARLVKSYLQRSFARAA